MKMKYYRLDMKGEYGLDEIEQEVGVGGGMLLRVHVEGGNTRVYFAADRAVSGDIGRAIKSESAPVEINADEVVQLD